MSSDRNSWNSSSFTLTVWPPYSGSSTVSPTLTSTGMSFPSCVRAPGPTATTLPSFGLSSFVSGRNTPPAVCGGWGVWRGVWVGHRIVGGG
jgi:hypothetical protein